MQTSANYRKCVGFQTFAHAPQAALKELAAGACAVFGTPDEPGHGRRAGTALGPHAIRETVAVQLAAYADGEVVNLITGQGSRLRSAPALLDLGDLSPELCSDAALDDAVEQLVTEIVRRSACPVLLGGSDRCLNAFLSSVWQERPTTRLLMLSNSVESLALAVGSKPLQERQPGSAMLLGPCGLQALRHWELLASASVRIIPAEALHANETDTLQAVSDWIESDATPCCLIADMQVLDSGYAAGTPQIDVGGLTPQQFMAVSNTWRGLPALAGVAVLNCAPALDLRGHTEHLAAHGLLQALAQVLFEAVQP